MAIEEQVLALVKEAIHERASDIFFLPKEKGYLIQLRIPKGLAPLKGVSFQSGQELLTWFKYAAQMDIAEKRRPQVGSMKLALEGKDYWLRLSSLGDYQGRESLVIRLIYALSQSRYFFPEQLEDLARFCQKRGLIITSGPTGSGKTTTMYELAKRLSQTKMVMTIEDPVEVHEGSFLQTQINPVAGISYLSLLKAALRHRPDVLIIGEIRDSETAHLAVDAALSGHLVLATVHAKSTFQTISRLESLGVLENELVNCLTAVSYQRLLPGKQGIACLLDLAGPDLLKKVLLQTDRGDFHNWADNLAQLLKEGIIDETTASQFSQG